MISVLEAGRPVRLDDGAEIGRGGEARVFRYDDGAPRAFKIYHPIDSWPASERRTAARRLALAAEKLRRFPKGTPPGLVAPRELVTDGKGALVGFSMDLVPGAVEIRKLGLPRFRQGCLDQNGVLALFERLAAMLHDLHGRGLVVGDMNDGNVLVASGEARVIDADSMQLPGLPCPVGHERFLDPALFGVDLLAAPAFSAGTDAYAFAVLFFATLQFVHPFGGSSAGPSTMLRRVEARHSVFRSDVRLPPSALPLAAMPATLHRYFEAVFEGGERTLPPRDVFVRGYRRCGCGLEIGGPRCPRCAMGVVVPAGIPFGETTVRRLHTATGTIVASRFFGRLAALEADDLGFAREDGSRFVYAWQAGDRAELAVHASYIGSLGRVRVFAGAAPVVTVTADEGFGETTFGVWDGGLVVARGGWLVDESTGRRLGQVLAGQTWIRCGRRFGFGFFRAGAVTKFFVFDPRRGGLLYVPMPAIAGRLVAADANFDDERVLVTIEEETPSGARRAGVHLVTDRGALEASLVGAPEDCPALAGTRGRAIAHGVVVLAKDGALETYAPDGAGGFARLHAFPCPAVTSENDLYPTADGALVAVSQARFVTEIRVA